jgi:hypothetical protein
VNSFVPWCLGGSTSDGWVSTTWRLLPLATATSDCAATANCRCQLPLPTAAATATANCRCRLPLPAAAGAALFEYPVIAPSTFGRSLYWEPPAPIIATTSAASSFGIGIDRLYCAIRHPDSVSSSTPLPRQVP